MNGLSKLREDIERIADFRKARGQRYVLHNLLVISILAFLSGADDFEGVAAFATQKASFLREKDLLGAKGLPSHDIFRWIFIRLDKESFSKFLSAWLSASIAQKKLTGEDPPFNSEGRTIHIDGKSLRASRRAEHTKTALQVVSAFVASEHLTLEQLIIDDKSCEKTAIPMLLNLLELKNSIVTIDAIATSKKNARIIAQKQGDYILALKKNNKLFYNEVRDFFRHFKDTTLITETSITHSKEHGREEFRTCRIISKLEYFPDAEGWENLKSLVAIEAHRTLNGKTSTETRYYLSSLPPKAAHLQQLIRGHWAIENNLHWSLDVAFNEDKHRLKDKNAAFCCTALRRFVLAVIRNANISKDSLKSQRLQIAWNHELLVKYFEWTQIIL